MIYIFWNWVKKVCSLPKYHDVLKLKIMSYNIQSGFGMDGICDINEFLKKLIK